MRSILTGLSGLLIILALGGCRSPRPTDYYLIRVEPAVPAAEEPLPLAVDVSDVRAPLRYQNRMVFRRGPYRVGFYEHSRWAALPAEMVRRALIDALNRSGLFDRMELIGQDPRADIFLLAEIVSFDQVIEGDEIRAEFSMILEAIRADTGSAAWSGRFSASVPQEAEGEPAAAMSAAVAEALTRAIEELAAAEELRSLPGDPASR